MFVLPPFARLFLKEFTLVVILRILDYFFKCVHPRFFCTYVRCHLQKFASSFPLYICTVCVRDDLVHLLSTPDPLPPPAAIATCDSVSVCVGRSKELADIADNWEDDTAEGDDAEEEEQKESSESEASEYDSDGQKLSKTAMRARRNRKKAEERRIKRMEENLANKSKDNLRCAFLS